jgi:hypothetical protein
MFSFIILFCRVPLKIQKSRTCDSLFCPSDILLTGEENEERYLKAEL